MLCDDEITRNALEEHEEEIRELFQEIVKCINEDDVSSAWKILDEAEKFAKDAGVMNFYKGVLSFAEGRLDDAEVFYKEGMKKGYVTESSLYHLGCVLMYQKKYPEALEYFSRADSMAPEISRSLEKKAEIYFELGRYKTMLVDASALIRRFPDNETGWHYKYLGMLMQNHLKEAVEILNISLEKFSDSDTVKMDLVQYYYIQDYETSLNYLNNYMEASEEFAQNLQVKRQKISLLYNLGMYEELDSEGTEFLAQVYTDEVALLMMIGLMHMKNYKKALQCAWLIKESMSDYEKSDDYLYYYMALYYEALAYKKSGESEKAKELFQDAADEYRRACLTHNQDMGLYIFRCMVLIQAELYDEALRSADFVETVCKDSMPEIYYIKSMIFHMTCDKENEDKYMEKLKESGSLPDNQFIL